MERKILFIAVFLAVCYCLSSCTVKANKDDVVLVVKDVLTTENGATITFRNSDRVLVSSFRPSISEGEVLMVKPNGEYLVLTENDHLDFVIILMLVLLAFFLGCLITGCYVKKCLGGHNSDSYIG